MRFVLMLVAIVALACGSADPPPTESEPEPEVASPPQRELERVSFASHDGITLVGSLLRGESEDAPAVLLMHQLSTNHREWMPVIDALRPLGVTVLAWDMRGHGSSIDRNGANVGWRAFTQDDWAKTIDDVRTAIDFLRADAHLSPSRIVLGGSSIGSSAAILTAVGRDDVAAVFALSPGRAYRGLDTISVVPGLTETPMLFVAARGEAPAKEAAEELARLGSGRALIVAGEAHGIRMTGAAPDLPQQLAAFVQSALE